MYNLINVLPPSNFAIFNCCYFLCYWLQRAETCTNCLNEPAFSIFEPNWYKWLHLLWGLLWVNSYANEQKFKTMTSRWIRLLNSKNNGQVFLFTTIFRHSNCFLSFTATVGKDGRYCYACKSHQKNIQISVPWGNLFDIFLTLQEHFG